MSTDTSSPISLLRHRPFVRFLYVPISVGTFRELSNADGYEPAKP
jgi:hypothetical protein